MEKGQEDKKFIIQTRKQDRQRKRQEYSNRLRIRRKTDSFKNNNDRARRP